MRSVVAVALLASLGATLHAQSPGVAPPLCSLQKVNGSCVVVIDRRYPVDGPVIQARRGATITVEVKRALGFESLTLEAQGAQSIAQSDAAAAFASAAMGSLGSLVVSTRSSGATFRIEGSVGSPPAAKDQSVDDRLAAIDRILKGARERIDRFHSAAALAFAQIQETQVPLPLAGGRTARPQIVAATPSPFGDLRQWKAALLCELRGECRVGAAPGGGLLDEAVALHSAILIRKGPGGLIDSTGVENQLAAIADAIRKLPADQQTFYTPQWQRRVSEWHLLLASLNAIDKSLVDGIGAFAEIAKAIDSLPATHPARPVRVGAFRDPRTSSSCIAGIYACQVKFAVNAVNLLVTPRPTGPTPPKKTTLTTITVLFAEPRLEVSTGAFISSMLNRSFGNTTAVSIVNGTPTPGPIAISETNPRPTMVPFVAANIRIGHEGTLLGRREAFYATGAIGLRDGAAEFGVGPSWSMRAFMFSALLHLGRDTRLTQGEQVGQVWCTACSPPSPSTQRFWKGAAAFGVSIRTPATFAALTGR